jgi:DNA-binding PadR family transcriptional regulator
LKHRWPPLPTITHLQFIGLTAIAARKEVSGRRLRQDLDQMGLKLEGPGFYQFMKRLFQAGLVTAQSRDEYGLGFREAFYTLTDAGRQTIRATLDFYLSHSGKAGVKPSRSRSS